MLFVLRTDRLRCDADVIPMWYKNIGVCGMSVSLNMDRYYTWIMADCFCKTPLQAHAKHMPYYLYVKGLQPITTQRQATKPKSTANNSSTHNHSIIIIISIISSFCLNGFQNVCCDADASHNSILSWPSPPKSLPKTSKEPTQNVQSDWMKRPKCLDETSKVLGRNAKHAIFTVFLHTNRIQAQRTNRPIGTDKPSKWYG